jgi:hypothetical protein
VPDFVLLECTDSISKSHRIVTLIRESNECVLGVHEGPDAHEQVVQDLPETAASRQSWSEVTQALEYRRVKRCSAALPFGEFKAQSGNFTFEIISRAIISAQYSDSPGTARW